MWRTLFDLVNLSKHMLSFHQIIVLTIFHELLSQEFLADHNIFTEISDFFCEFNIIRLCSPKPFKLFFWKLKVTTLIWARIQMILLFCFILFIWALYFPFFFEVFALLVVYVHHLIDNHVVENQRSFVFKAFHRSRNRHLIA